MRLQIFPKLLHHHRFVIGPVTDVHLGNGFAFEGDDVGADAIEEPVMAGNSITDDHPLACIDTVEQCPCGAAREKGSWEFEAMTVLQGFKFNWLACSIFNLWQ
jgi:hypothetical protein